MAEERERDRKRAAWERVVNTGEKAVVKPEESKSPEPVAPAQPEPAAPKQPEPTTTPPAAQITEKTIPAVSEPSKQETKPPLSDKHVEEGKECPPAEPSKREGPAEVAPVNNTQTPAPMVQSEPPKPVEPLKPTEPEKQVEPPKPAEKVKTLEEEQTEKLGSLVVQIEQLTAARK